MLSDFYQQIQVIMTFLGFYDGDCDGVWGPKCIAAKRKWEYDDSFEPAVPSNGLPFTGRDRLPKGLMYLRKGLQIQCLKMTEEERQKILTEKGKLLCCHHIDEQEEIVVAPKVVATVSESAAPKVATAAESPIDQPVQTPAPTPAPAPVVPEEEEDEEEEEEKPVQNNSNSGNKNWTQQRKK